MEKLNFLQNEFPIMLATLKADAKGEWGVMNAQEMVEHMSDSVRVANGRNPHTLHSPADKVDQFKAFAMSDREFKPNTKNALMAELPVPLLKASMVEAIEEYKQEIAGFVQHFKGDEAKNVTNPFFGELNFEEWIHLLHKHAVHHAKQFGLL